MKIVNHTTKDECNLKFQAYSYFSRERQRKVCKLGGKRSMVWCDGWHLGLGTCACGLRIGLGTCACGWRIGHQMYLNLWPRSLGQSPMQLVLLCTLSMVTGTTTLRLPRSHMEMRRTRSLNQLCRCGKPRPPSKPVVYGCTDRLTTPPCCYGPIVRDMS